MIRRVRGPAPKKQVEGLFHVPFLPYFHLSENFFIECHFLGDDVPRECPMNTTKILDPWESCHLPQLLLPYLMSHKQGANNHMRSDYSKVAAFLLT